MKLTGPIEAYLLESPYINYSEGKIQEFIATLDQGEELDRIRAAYEFVRDQVAHSFDIHESAVTRTAAEVMELGHGICYAKSHLLAAILRGIGIPAGICYQRLTLFDKPEDGYCLHALNTVYLRDLDKWIRLDARGNKPGVQAEFSIHEERLAFPIRKEYGELDYWINYDQPHPIITKTLENHKSCEEMYLSGLPEELDV